MANDARARQSRPTATPQNSAAMGMILVLVGAGIALLLFVAGGGNAKDANAGKSAADIIAGNTTSTSTTTVADGSNTTPPASLEILVGNGSGKVGRGKKTADKLASLGYANAKGVDGKASAVTTVYFAVGARDDAVAVAKAMGLGADSVAALPGADTPLKSPVGSARVVVLVGLDFDPDTAKWGTATQPSTR